MEAPRWTWEPEHDWSPQWWLAHYRLSRQRPTSVEARIKIDRLGFWTETIAWMIAFSAIGYLIFH